MKVETLYATIHVGYEEPTLDNELVAQSYSRQECSCVWVSCPFVNGGARTLCTVKMVEFPCKGEVWKNVGYIALWDAAVEGSPLFTFPCNGKDIEDGESVSLGGVWSPILSISK